MKKIINGKRYDTETAEEIASASYSNPSDFWHWTESLYLKRTGEYFIEGEGGPMSRWSTNHTEGSSSGGEGIKPLSEDEARAWVERNANESFEDRFGEVAE